MSEMKHPVYENAVYSQHHGGTCPVEPALPVLPEYRGVPSLPKPAQRITCAPAGRMDWSHDGGSDDIVGYWLLSGGIS